MDDAKLTEVTRFVYEMGFLKRLPRSGWLVAGVRNPESVAEHSFRTAVIGYLLAHMEGANPERTALICLFHDSQETRIGDVPYVSRGYVTTAPDQQVTDDQVAGLPKQIGQSLIALVAEHTAGDSLEARLAKDADKLECLVQAREYEAQGNADIQSWIDSSFAALRSSSAKRLAQACLDTSPADWWQAVTGSWPGPRSQA